MTDQPVCYLQEGDDPRDHDITDGIVCAHCYDALAEQVSEAAELFEDVLLSPDWLPEGRVDRIRDMVAVLRGQPKPCVPVECPPVEPIEVNQVVPACDPEDHCTCAARPAVLLFNGVPILFESVYADNWARPFCAELEAAERLGIADQFRVAEWADAFPLVGDQLSESLNGFREAAIRLVADPVYAELVRDFGTFDDILQRGESDD